MPPKLDCTTSLVKSLGNVGSLRYYAKCYAVFCVSLVNDMTIGGTVINRSLPAEWYRIHGKVELCREMNYVTRMLIELAQLIDDSCFYE